MCVCVCVCIPFNTKSITSLFCTPPSPIPSNKIFSKSSSDFLYLSPFPDNASTIASTTYTCEYMCDYI